MSAPSRRVGTLVVGAGQAGLAAGYHLAAAGEPFLLVDGAGGPGTSWRERWESLRLFTPAAFNGLPGMPFPGPPDHHPGKDEVADYLAAYAARFALPTEWGARVLEVGPEADGGFRVATSAGSLLARRVIVATGPFQRPRVPHWASRVEGPVRIHSAEYRSPRSLPAGPTLVVGGANSGVQIAAELALTRPVTLAVGTRLPRLPLRALGRSVFWWLEATGALGVPVTTPLGRRASRRDFLIGRSPGDVARSHGVRLAPRALDAEGGCVRFADGRSAAFDAVVFATGYEQDHGWLRVPGALDGEGSPRQLRGLTPVPGLAFLGLSWMHTRGSALLGWVGRDAAHVVKSLTTLSPPAT